MAEGLKDIMKSFYRLLLLTITLALRQHPAVVADADADAVDIQVEYHEPETPETDDDVQVQVSSECAVVLVTGGLIAGGVAAAATGALLGMLLNVIGFAAIGVEGGSLAAQWQSTFPLVKAGSTFSKLQSITMSEAGVGVVPVGAAVGGTKADSIDSESWEGKVLSTLTLLVSKVEDEVKKGEEEVNKLLVSVTSWFDLVEKKAEQGGQWVAEKSGETVDNAKSVWAHQNWFKEVKEGGQM